MPFSIAAGTRRKARFFSFIDLPIQFKRGIPRPNRSTHFQIFYSERNIFSRAEAAREAGIFSIIDFYLSIRFPMMYPYIAYPNQATHFHFHLVSKTHFRALRVRRVCEAGFFSVIYFYLQTQFQWGITCPNRSTHFVFYIVSGTGNTFSRTAGARRA